MGMVLLGPRHPDQAARWPAAARATEEGEGSMVHLLTPAAPADEAPFPATACIARLRGITYLGSMESTLLLL